jgi:hypothetical protein
MNNAAKDYKNIMVNEIITLEDVLVEKLANLRNKLAEREQKIGIEYLGNIKEKFEAGKIEEVYQLIGEYNEFSVNPIYKSGNLSVEDITGLYSEEVYRKPFISIRGSGNVFYFSSILRDFIYKFDFNTEYVNVATNEKNGLIFFDFSKDAREVELKIKDKKMKISCSPFGRAVRKVIEFVDQPLPIGAQRYGVFADYSNKRIVMPVSYKVNK